MVNLAEQGYFKQNQQFDPAWQEMLNHSTMKVSCDTDCFICIMFRYSLYISLYCVLCHSGSQGKYSRKHFVVEFVICKVLIIFELGSLHSFLAQLLLLS